MTKEAQTNERLDFVDIMKGLGIMCVILGHLLQKDTGLKSCIYFFHMPLFFFAYGLVAKSMRVSELLKKRAWGILVPFLFWGIAFTGITIDKGLAFLFYGSNESILRSGSNGMLWFLVSLFFGSVIANAVLAIGKDKTLQILIRTAAAALLLLASMGLFCFHDKVIYKGKVLGLPFGLDVTLLAASFILIGAAARDGLVPLAKKMNGYLTAIIGIVLFCGFLTLGYLTNRIENNYPSMAVYRLGNALIYWVVAIGACAGLMLFSVGISEVLGRGLAWLTWIGRNTLVIFLMHRTIIYPVKNYLAAHEKPLFFFAAFAAVLIYGCICAKLVDVLVPELCGKHRVKKAS